MQFCLQHGSPTRGHKPPGNALHFTFFHMRPADQQPTITGVDLYHKNVQPFVSVHYARFHSECHTNDKRSNETCENNIILPTNIQHLKIHVRY